MHSYSCAKFRAMLLTQKHVRVVTGTMCTERSGSKEKGTKKKAADETSSRSGPCGLWCAYLCLHTHIHWIPSYVPPNAKATHTHSFT